MPPKTPPRRKLLFAILSFVVFCLGSAATTKADEYILTVNNFGQPGSNFGTITTTLVGNTIQVNVTLAAGYVMHNQGVGFNVVGAQTGVAINVTSGNAAFFTNDLSGGNMDGYGNFDYQVNGPNTATAQANNLSSVTFIVSRDAGFTNANQLAFVNDQGFIFAVQIAPTQGGATGFTASASAVPEPTTLLLVGTGLSGAAAWARKRRRRQDD